MLAFPPDSTFLIQIVSFLILWQLLRKLAWEPMLAVLQEREERTAGNRRRAEALRGEAQESQRRYEEEMGRARARMNAEVSKVRAQIQEQERAAIQLARREASERLAAQRAALAKEAEAVRAAFAEQAQELSRVIAARLLGREPQ